MGEEGLGMLCRRTQPDERDGRVPRRNLNRRGRRSGRRQGTWLERRRDEERARVYGRRAREPHGRRLRSAELGQPLLPREGEHAVRGPALAGPSRAGCPRSRREGAALTESSRAGCPRSRGGGAAWPGSSRAGCPRSQGRVRLRPGRRRQDACAPRKSNATRIPFSVNRHRIIIHRNNRATGHPTIAAAGTALSS